MKKIFFKSCDKIIIALLGLIGLLTGCNLIHPPVAEYGVPYADYEIKGTVTDSITSAPIQNIRVTVTQIQTYIEKDSIHTHIDTLALKETDSAGKYDIRFQSFPLDKLTYKVKADDMDGLTNGGDFNSQAKDVLFIHTDLTGANGGWYNGKALKIVDLKLKKK